MNIEIDRTYWCRIESKEEQSNIEIEHTDDSDGQISVELAIGTCVEFFLIQHWKIYELKDNSYSSTMKEGS